MHIGYCRRNHEPTARWLTSAIKTTKPARLCGYTSSIGYCFAQDQVLPWPLPAEPASRDAGRRVLARFCTDAVLEAAPAGFGLRR